MQQNTQDLPLRDIHLPDGVSWWPPALGWWLVLAVILSVFVVITLIKKIRNQNLLKKETLSAFYAITVKYEVDKNKQELVRELSILLRRISISYYDRDSIASITGDAWLKKLDEIFTAINEANTEPLFLSDTGRMLTNSPYQQNIEIDAEALIDICEKWIKALPTKKSNINLTPAEVS